MEPSKVQWLQRMGIDVWRSRPFNGTPTQQDSADLKNTESTGVVSHSVSAKKIVVETTLGTTKIRSPQELNSESKSTLPKSDLSQQTSIDLYCCSSDGLLLINDNSALDRDFTEDIFRAFRLLRNLTHEKADVSFFRFIWPSDKKLHYVKDANDTTLEGAKRAFRAKAKSIGNGPPVLVVSIGKGAIQLVKNGSFSDARVLHLLDEPSSSSFKMSLWNFLRDVR